MAEVPDLPAPVPALAPAREALIGRLTESFARDELTVEEFERRLSLAYDATSGAELQALAADLPARLPSPPADTPPLRISSVLSNVVRVGPQILPRRLEIRSWTGNVELDLSGAELPPGVTEIVLDVVLGNVEIRLPWDVQVEDQLDPILASFEYRRRGRQSVDGWPASAAASVVRFSGRLVLGNVTVTTR